MDTKSETKTLIERQLQARGDVAIVALKAMVTALKPMVETNTTVQQHLAKILERQPQTGTLLNIIADVVAGNVTTLSEVVHQSAQVLAEIESFMESVEADVQVESAIDNVVLAIKSVSDFHRQMDNDEIKKQMGLK